MDDTTQKIRARAHALWEAAGRPDGMEEEHWAEAEREVQGSADQSGDVDRNLDDSLDETFPSSDPVSETQPGGGITGPGAGV